LSTRRPCASAPARERRQRESAGVAERVEHAPPVRQRTDARSIVALVQVEARLLAPRDVDAIGESSLADPDV
jgi:hypothetical protein